MHYFIKIKSKNAHDLIFHQKQGLHRNQETVIVVSSEQTYYK